MMDKFKAFLAGSPYWMNSEQLDGWVNLVAVILPSVLEKWYDTDFGCDVWAKEGGYYEVARLKLAGSAVFRRECDKVDEVLQGLRYLVNFFTNEKRKAGLGKTVRKARNVGGKWGIPALSEVEVLEEGAIIDMHIAKHERNPALRRVCIEHYRARNGGRIACEACGMAFSEVYGEFGDGYIEVHHLSPISQMGESHTVDPKRDLVPLCANCHAMIHRLMVAEKRSTGMDLEGDAALERLRGRIEENR